MTDREYERRERGIVMGASAVCIVILLLMMICGGCQSTKYVPIESVKTEHKDREVEKLVTDTVRTERVVFIKGDTLIDIRTEQKIMRVEIHDTCLIVRTDTIRIPYPVERELSRWESIKMDMGGFAIGGIAFVILALIAWLVIKFARK